jgi:pimeloyl-ACP methyl ester carboxylesterase
MPVARTADGVSVAYTVDGRGPRTLVFLHEWGGSRRCFAETIAYLDPAATRAIAVDLRGHGDSDKPDVEPTWDSFARDVFAAADAEGVDRFVAVGHSMGGKLAQYLPLVDPSRIDGLVLVASAPASELAIPASAARWLDLAGDAQALADHTVRPYLRRPVPEEVIQRFGEDAAKIPRTYLEWTMQLVSSTSFVERLTSVRTPALVVSASTDPLHAAAADAILDALPNARLESFECGPEIPMELPARFAQLLERFVGQLP